MSSDAKVNSADAAYAQKASSAEVVIQPLGLPKEFRPKHIAIIMDGNGRWAMNRKRRVSDGHEAGVRSLEYVVRCCQAWEIQGLTLYCFSSENWKRSKEEVSYLMMLFERSIRQVLQHINADVRVNFIGDASRLNPSLQKAMRSAVLKTQNNTGLILNFALNYGGRTDIVSACKRIATAVATGKITLDQIDENMFASYLSTSNLWQITGGHSHDSISASGHNDVSTSTSSDEGKDDANINDDHKNNKNKNKNNSCSKGTNCNISTLAQVQEQTQAQAQAQAQAQQGSVSSPSDSTPSFADSPLPDPDLLIRTSGEQRLSNFLLWEIAYTEMYFPSTLWPDFGEPELREALFEFAKRNRRFGGRIEVSETSPSTSSSASSATSSASVSASSTTTPATSMPAISAMQSTLAAMTIDECAKEKVASVSERIDTNTVGVD